MARKLPEIRTESYIHVGDELVRFDDLTPEQKREAATKLKVKYLNTLYRGIAVFTPIEGDADTIEI